MADFDYRHRAFLGLCAAAHVPLLLALLINIAMAISTPSSVGDSVHYGTMSGIDFLAALVRIPIAIIAGYFLALLISGIPAVLFGIPVILLCRRFGCEYWWSLAAGGAVAGLLTVILFVYLGSRLDSGGPGRGIAFQNLLFSLGAASGVICGALSALAFWYVTYRWAPARP